MDCSPLSLSIHEILQARILKWVAIPFSRRSSQLRDQTWSPELQQILYHLSHINSKITNGRNEEELKSLLVRVKKESEKAGLKLNIKKTKIMAYSSITSWQIEGEKVKAVTDFIFWASKITADSDCSHESKRHMLL